MSPTLLDGGVARCPPKVEQMMGEYQESLARLEKLNDAEMVRSRLGGTFEEARLTAQAQLAAAAYLVTSSGKEIGQEWLTKQAPMSLTDEQGGSPAQKALDALSWSYDRGRAAPGSRSALDELRARGPSTLDPISAGSPGL